MNINFCIGQHLFYSLTYQILSQDLTFNISIDIMTCWIFSFANSQIKFYWSVWYTLGFSYIYIWAKKKTHFLAKLIKKASLSTLLLRILIFWFKGRAISSKYLHAAIYFFFSLTILRDMKFCTVYDSSNHSKSQLAHWQIAEYIVTANMANISSKYCKTAIIAKYIYKKNWNSK